MLLFRITLLIWIVALPVTKGFAAGQSKSNVAPKGEQEVKISADHMVQEGKKRGAM